MVDHLRDMAHGGYTLLTWNGLGFDFDVLAEEADALEPCRDMALSHVDMMFHIFCDRGFPVALDKAAHAMGIPGKPAGMSGFLAPQLWAQGHFQEVIDYVAQDVRIALQVAQLCEERCSFAWTTRRGTSGSMPLGKGWLTVREALELPEPDTSWMSNPLSKNHHRCFILILYYFFSLLLVRRRGILAHTATNESFSAVCLFNYNLRLYCNCCGRVPENSIPHGCWSND